MYPTFADFFKDFTGWQLPFPFTMIQSFGLLVAISFLFAAGCLSIELKRKEQNGLLKPFVKKTLTGEAVKPTELIVSGLIGFVLGYKILDFIINYSDASSNPGAYILSGKGSVLGGVIGAALAAYSKYREVNKKKLETPQWVEETIHPFQIVGNTTIVAAIFGFAGSKLFDMLENPSEIQEFLANPGANLFSGLTFYGGLILAAFAVIYYTNSYGVKPIHMVDATAPSLMLAYGVGRLGCQVAGDGDWGINNLAPKPGWMSFLPDWVWSYRYPHNVVGEGIPIPGCDGKHCFQLADPVFPTPLYEAIVCIALFFLLWSLRKRIVAPGVMFSFYLMLNGIERFAVEHIRINTQYHIFGMGITQAQIIAPILFLLGLTGVIFYHNRHKKSLSN
ncbi:MAG: prolipoprotein diacylglyceryl transferase family protein [Bacteroidota bacterium]